MTISSDQNQSYLPVYDLVPEDPKESREYLTEALKEMSNSINAKEIGYYLDEELLSGKQLFPGVPTEQNNQGQTYRQILRKVINFGQLPNNAPPFKAVPHGITVDTNFTLVQIWGAATSSTALFSIPIPYTEVADPPQGHIQLYMSNTDVVIFVGSDRSTFDRCIIVIEYVQEV